MKVTYGKDVTSVDDPFVLLGSVLFIQITIKITYFKIPFLAERAGSLTVQSGTPAATLVDFFPIIKLVSHLLSAMILVEN